MAKKIKQKGDRSLLENYTNDDYDKFELVDFRTLRYQKKESQIDHDEIEELEAELAQKAVTKPDLTDEVVKEMV